MTAKQRRAEWKAKHALRRAMLARRVTRHGGTFRTVREIGRAINRAFAAPPEASEVQMARYRQSMSAFLDDVAVSHEWTGLRR